MAEGQPVSLGLWDTAGQEDYDRLVPFPIRTLTSSSSAFPSTTREVTQMSGLSGSPKSPIIWIRLPRGRKRAKIILVGTKLDLREDSETLDRLNRAGTAPITYQQGVQMAKEIGAVRYMECSALTQQGLKAIFDEAIRVVLFPTREEKDAEGSAVTKAKCCGGKCLIQ